MWLWDRIMDTLAAVLDTADLPLLPDPERFDAAN